MSLAIVPIQERPVGPSRTFCLAGGPSCRALFRVPRWYEDDDQPPPTERTNAVLGHTSWVNRRSGLVKHFLYRLAMATVPVFATHLLISLLSSLQYYPGYATQPCLCSGWSCVVSWDLWGREVGTCADRSSSCRFFPPVNLLFVADL